jgi:hypothetical protein
MRKTMKKKVDHFEKLNACWIDVSFFKMLSPTLVQAIVEETIYL